MDIKQLRICHPEPCVRDLKKTRMIEILRFAQKRSSPPEGAKGNDKVNGFFIILSCWNAATKSGGFDNAAIKQARYKFTLISLRAKADSTKLMPTANGRT